MKPLPNTYHSVLAPRRSAAHVALEIRFHRELNLLDRELDSIEAWKWQRKIARRIMQHSGLAHALETVRGWDAAAPVAVGSTEGEA